MKQYKYILLLFLFLISSCSDSNGNDSGAIQVDIKNQASQQIQIVSSTSTKTGKVNPVEVQITLKNNSSSQQQLLLDGRWLDSNGGFNGGSQRIIKLEAGQSLSIVEGTRSSRVTRYQASLNVSNKTQGQVLNEALASNKQVIATGYGMTYSTTPSTEKPMPIASQGRSTRCGGSQSPKLAQGHYACRLRRPGFDELLGPTSVGESLVSASKTKLGVARVQHRRACNLEAGVWGLNDHLGEARHHKPVLFGLELPDHAPTALSETPRCEQSLASRPLWRQSH